MGQVVFLPELPNIERQLNNKLNSGNLFGFTTLGQFTPSGLATGFATGATGGTMEETSGGGFFGGIGSLFGQGVEFLASREAAEFERVQAQREFTLEQARLSALAAGNVNAAQVGGTGFLGLSRGLPVTLVLGGVAVFVGVMLLKK